jgi:hypothetical protein
MPVIHVMGAGGVFRGAIAKSSPAFLFVWTLHALGMTGMFCLILALTYAATILPILVLALMGELSLCQWLIVKA